MRFDDALLQVRHYESVVRSWELPEHDRCNAHQRQGYVALAASAAAATGRLVIKIINFKYKIHHYKYEIHQF